MSEFKYACPICGQHIRCDSSQAGSVMECPTCFQKITVPQAPAAGDQKFIITGSQVTERKRSLPGNAGGSVARPKKSPVAALLLVGTVILAAGATCYYFFGPTRTAEPAPPSGSAPVMATFSCAAWQSHDIGVVGAAGTFSQSKDVVTLTGSGADIWHQADGFHFVFQPQTGDGSLTAEILNVQNTAEWAKAGVMVRETTNANSVFALASLRADGQAQFIWRKAIGAEAEASGLSGGAGFPKWVKVVRSGNNFSAFYKMNAPDEWSSMGTAQTISMSPNTEIGLIVCSHNDGTLCQAQFDQVTWQEETRPSPDASRSPSPRASGETWTLDLGAVAIPDTPAAGRVHGKIFTAERMALDGGTLTLRTQEFPPDAGVSIYLKVNRSEELAGQSIAVDPGSAGAPWVNLRYKDAQGQPVTQTEKAGYALRIEFGAIANGHMPGKIYLCTADAGRSYVAGAFNAEIIKPNPQNR
jgi:DNA-directed RNA polymerase subunit RPC12/RpoP